MRYLKAQRYVDWPSELTQTKSVRRAKRGRVAVAVLILTVQSSGSLSAVADEAMSLDTDPAPPLRRTVFASPKNHRFAIASATDGVSSL